MVEAAWFTPARGVAETARRLYVIPHAGAGAAVVAGLARELRPDTAVHGVRLPGRESRLTDRPSGSLTELAGELASALAAHADGQPFVLLGHCAGARLAIETARALPDGVPIEAVGVSASPAAQPPPEHRGGAGLQFEQFMAFVAADAGTLDLLDYPRELQQLLEPALRMDYGLAAEHRDDARPLRVPLLILSGRRDQVLPAELVRAWRDRTTAGSLELEVDGGHDSLVAAPAEFARSLRTGFAWLGSAAARPARISTTR